MPKPRYEEFAYSLPYDKESIERAVAARQRVYAPTGSGSDTVDQSLAVYLTIPEGVEHSSPFIACLGAWSDDSGRRERGYFDALVALSGHPVVSVNSPGVDFSQWRDPEFEDAHLLTPDQTEELIKRGSFKKVGGAVARALDYAIEHFDLSDTYILSASSLATATAAAVASAAPERAHGIVTAEIVNNKVRSLGTLAYQFAVQQRFAAGYLEQNPDIIPSESLFHWAKRTREAWPANWATARALQRDQFLSDLGDPSPLAEQGVPWHLNRGSRSKLADAGAHTKVYQALCRAGVSASSKIYEGHDHPYTMTPQSVINGVKEVE